ncbi:F-box domain-containing protein [Mycena sanguinolenta]|uniref:F-box domain-containing protein n=1 Tax=Mycena sanguinolenta TaxID=230812 RepID=A0A8H6Y1H5_9AGAR|nr:F-box domain-containing protein [Mycena sanguinolenta]
MILSDLPTDILLEIVKVLPLPDPLALLITCRSLNALSNEVSFWMSVLETTRRRSPIACPPHTDLSQFTLPRLKDLALSWLKLQHNWDQRFPRIVQPATSARLPRSEPTLIILAVQGTDILVLATGGSLFCWDAKLGAPFPFPALDTGGQISQIAGSDMPGVCYLAIIARIFNGAFAALDRRRYIITIKHEGGKVTSMTSESSQVSTPQLNFESLFVAEDMVGTIGTMEYSQECLLVVDGVGDEGRRFPNSNSILKLHRSVPHHAFLVCIAYQGHLYIILEDASSVQIQHIPRKGLRAGRQDSGYLFHSQISSIYSNFEELCYMVPSTPFYGVTAAFVRLHWNYGNETALVTSFTFLLNTFTDAYDNGSGAVSPLEFDPDCVSEYVPGQLVDISLVWQDHSGFNVTAVIQPNDPLEPPRLVLVRYHPETKSTSVHDLTVPDTIDVKKLESVCIDDTSGAVHLVDTEARLSTLRYV